MTSLKVDGSSAVISNSELSRIRASVMQLGIEPLDRTQEKIVLHEKSVNRVKNWGNTIDALRRKKEADRLARFQQQENERIKIDMEEAAIQEETRRRAIARANKLLHDEQDRVKAFHSKLLLCDVLDERETQIRKKQSKKQMLRTIDSQFHESEMEQLRRAEEEEVKKLQAAAEKSKQIAHIQKHQLEEYKERYIMKLQEEALEGELIKQKAVEDMEMEKENERKRREKAKMAQAETIKANQFLKTLRLEEEERIREQDRKTEEHARKKAEVMEIRRQREEQRFREKQDARQRIIDAQIERLSKIKNDENERLNKQLTEAEAKADAELARRKAVYDRQEAAIDMSRSKQLELKKQLRDQQMAEDQAFKEMWRQRNVELELEEEESRLQQRERNKQLQTFQKKQITHKHRKTAEEVQEEMQTANISQKTIAEEEKQFYSYAEKVLKEWVDMGKNVTPLILELKNYKKKLAV
eukprot:GILK01001376.1.p1 GENE.GILK01001376.1~~GILK01001376.1.p1  ORF type:complete len:470 (+),score=155.83 GILK01001376.1:91-1500(+)